MTEGVILCCTGKAPCIDEMLKAVDDVGVDTILCVLPYCAK